MILLFRLSIFGYMTKKELFIGRINAAVTNEQLDHYFNSFGRVNSFKRPVDRRTGRNRDFAFVSFVENNVFESKYIQCMT